MAEENEFDPEKRLQGVVFRRSIRASYASLDIINIPFPSTQQQYAQSPDEDGAHVIVLVQFSVAPSLRNVDSDGGFVGAEMRSRIRRLCKIGDLIQFSGRWSRTAGREHCGRFEVNYCPAQAGSAEDCVLRVVQVRHWDMEKCQAVRGKFYPIVSPRRKEKKQGAQGDGDSGVISGAEADRKKKRCKNAGNSVSLDQKSRLCDCNGNKAHSGGGVGKRRQGEILAEFLIGIIMEKIWRLKDDDNDHDSHGLEHEGAHRDDLWQKRLRNEAIQFLNSGSGVIDAAGGSGHVSLALALSGVKSTVIDPREGVGRLPGRDRKVLRKAMKRVEDLEKGGNGTLGSPLSKPVPVQFEALRAWFLSKPDGVDTVYREGAEYRGGYKDDCDDPPLPEANKKDLPAHAEGSSSTSQKPQTVIPICSPCSQPTLLQGCSAVVALHPDEATGSIIDYAISHCIPFAVVPCCVFSRLFPERLTKKRTVVSTYDDLLEWLREKDERLCVKELKFGGANRVVYGTF